jgi:hypothetical protein
MQGNLGMIVRPEELSAFDADSPIAKGCAFGRARCNTDVTRHDWNRSSPRRRSGCCFAVALPQVFQSFGQSLLLYAAVCVPGVSRKYELITIPLRGQHFRHVFIG